MNLAMEVVLWLLYWSSYRQPHLTVCLMARCGLHPRQEERLPTSSAIRPVGRWALSSLAGASGLHSSACALVKPLGTRPCYMHTPSRYEGALNSTCTYTASCEQHACELLAAGGSPATLVAMTHWSLACERIHEPM
jgi:hypothetical protein